MKTLILYWTHTGNTAKVAAAIAAGLRAAGAAPEMLRLDDTLKVDLFAYDLICLGFPSYQWRPPEPVDRFLRTEFAAARKEGRVKIGAPPVPGKHALIFCTYSGPHTGIREAIPAALYAGQYLEHMGIPVIDEWYIIGEFHGSEEASTRGRLGDIRGRPNLEDLAQVTEDARALAAQLNP